MRLKEEKLILGEYLLGYKSHNLPYKQDSNEQHASAPGLKERERERREREKEGGRPLSYLSTWASSSPFGLRITSEGDEFGY